MTLKRFQELLREANPNIKLKVRRDQGVTGDIIGVYGGHHYICRMTKGELQLNGYRMAVYDPTDILGPLKQGNIVKRGRKTVINILQKNRWITRKQASKILWGLKKQK